VEYAPVERVDKEVEMGGIEIVDIQPLAIMGARGTHSISLDWVLEFCQELGLICDGHEEDLLALFAAIEANRHNKKRGSDQQRSDRSGNKGNCELKGLECTLNYDVKGASKVSGKGRAVKYC
jgi:hypothetical protein